MIRIVVVGSANVDFVVLAPHVPAPGETVLGRDFVMAMGGKGANQAVGISRLGGDVVFVARVGSDVFGDQCLDAYTSEGIHTEFVGRDLSEATGVALITVSEDGENSITVASGANMKLTPQHVEAASRAFQGSDVLVMQLEVPLETNLVAAELAHDYGLRVVLNPAPARELPSELLRLVDVITPNRIELAQLLGVSETEVNDMDEAQLAESVLSLGPEQGVITLGARGSLVATAERNEHVAPFEITPVDTTAAGDAFNAGLAVALARSQTLAQAARYANACGALAATKMGAQPSLPRMTEVEQFMR